MKFLKIFCICSAIFLYTRPIQTSEGLLSAGASLGKDAAKDSAVWGERFNMAFDMAMPMGVGMAASNANQFLSEEQAAIFADFQLEQTAITNSLKSWSAGQSGLMTKQMNTINAYFKNQFNAVNISTAHVFPAAQAEANYLFQNISVAQPATSLVSFSEAGVFDQWFSTGIMATPASSFTWYNYFIAGDWVFDPLTNSFWQNQAVACSSKTTPLDPKNPDPGSVDILSSNSIFVEYYPSQKPYTIEGSFTLYAATYPFFAGIMFNKNRWISGNLEGKNKCRLLGIYASSETNAGIYFAEQYELSDKDALAENPKNPNPVKIPLLQIINGHVSALAQISNNTLKNLSLEPVTFNFKITTNPTSVSCKIWAATDKEPTQAFLIQNLDQSLYIYHTLGFMSPGVATEWKITAPKELTFSPQAILNFKNKVFPPKN